MHIDESALNAYPNQAVAPGTDPRTVKPPETFDREMGRLESSFEWAMTTCAGMVAERDRWREECIALRAENERLQDENEHLAQVVKTQATSFAGLERKLAGR